MINTFFYMALPSAKSKYAYSQELGERITRVNMPHVFKYNDCVTYKDKEYKVLSCRYNIDEDAFIATICLFK